MQMFAATLRWMRSDRRQEAGFDRHASLTVADLAALRSKEEGAAVDAQEEPSTSGGEEHGVGVPSQLVLELWL